MNENKSCIIAVDFDGTLCSNKWPEIGRPNWKLINRLKAEQEKGAKIILWTCRTDRLLREAVGWCNINCDLFFDAINENLPEIIEKFGGDCRKIFADVYIDNKARQLSFSTI